MGAHRARPGGAARRRHAAAPVGSALALAGSALVFPVGAAALPMAGADGRGALVPAEGSSGRVPPEDAILFARLAALAHSTPSQPHADASLAPAVRFRLAEAFTIAERQVATEPRCGALFGRFGVAGTEALSRTRYRGGGDVGACLHQVPAFTCVGCLQTVLCPAFSSLGSVAAATILLHEALHQAGLPERPPAVGAMSSTEITRMVETSCAL